MSDGIRATILDNRMWFYPVICFILVVICGTYAEEICRKNKRDRDAHVDMAVTVQPVPTGHANVPGTSNVPTTCPTKEELEARLRTLLDSTIDNIKRFESTTPESVNISYDLATLINARESIEE
ncbi:unnamed protein product, partial [Oppiella nova]